MHKLTVQYCDPADPAVFEEHYREVHVPLAAKIPGLRRYTVSKPHGLSATAPYLIAELWFDDSAALNAGPGPRRGQRRPPTCRTSRSATSGCSPGTSKKYPPGRSAWTRIPRRRWTQRSG